MSLFQNRTKMIKKIDLNLFLAALIVISGWLLPSTSTAQTRENYLETYDKAIDYYQDQEYLKALYNLQSIEEQNSYNKNISFYLGLSCVELNWYASALNYFFNAADLYADNLSNNYVITIANVGAMYALIGQDDLALRYINESLGMKPDYATSLNNLASVLMEQGKFDEAISVVLEGLETANSKNKSYLYSNLGDLYIWKEQPDSAYFYYDKAIEIDPNFINALIAKAIELNKSGKKKSEYQSLCNDIIKNETAYLTKNPEGYRNLSNRAQAYQLLNNRKAMKADIDRAMPIVNKLIALHPEGYQLVKMRANLYDMLGDTQKAIADYKTVLQLNPTNPTALNYLKQNNQ